MSLQIDALTKHGTARGQIFTDKLSGAKTERPGLTKCLETLRSGDILVAWRLDRLGRSMRHLITLVEDLRNKGIGFRSLNEGAIDTTMGTTSDVGIRGRTGGIGGGGRYDERDNAYDYLGRDPVDSDMVFAYLWPGEESAIEMLFDKNAAEGALLLTYNRHHSVRLQRRLVARSRSR